MAINNYSGFADGFTSGFGLMGSYQDSQQKKKQAKLDTEYRDSESKKAQANSDRTFQQTADTNEREFDLKTKESDRNFGLLDRKTKTEETEAKARRVAADAAVIRAEAANNPLSLEGMRIKAETARLAEQTKEAERARVQAESQTKRFTDAKLLNGLWERASAGASGNFSNEDLMKTYQEMLSLEGSGLFDANVAVQRSAANAGKVIGSFFQRFSNGEDVDIRKDTPTRVALTQTLGLASSPLIGTRLDETFVNAPERMRKGDWQVNGMAMWDATASEGNLSGLLVVEVEDVNDPTQTSYYFPDLTAGRSSSSNRYGVDMKDATQAVAGAAHMFTQVGPVMSGMARQAAIYAKYGDEKGDNGVKTYNEAVESRVQKNLYALKSGGSTSNMLGLDPDIANMPSGQSLTPDQVSRMRSNIEEELLFPNKIDHLITRAERWVVAAEEKLKAAPISFGDKGKGGMTLGDVIPDAGWNPRIVANLASFFGKDGKLEDPEAFKTEMKKLGYPLDAK